ALAGTATGIATGMKHPGLLLLAPLYAAGVLGSPAHGWRRCVPGRAVAVGAAVAAALFLATSPFLVLDAGSFLRQWAPAGLAVFGSRPGAPSRAFAYHVSVSLRYGTGLLFTLLAAPAVLLAVAGREPLWRLAGIFAVTWYVVVGASPVHHVRYLTPLLPVLALLVAVLLGRLAAMAGPRRAPLVLALLTAAIVWEPLRAAMAHDAILSRTDTRVLASRWLAEHARPGDPVAILGTNIWPHG